MGLQTTFGLVKLTLVARRERRKVCDALRSKGLDVELRGRTRVDLYVTPDLLGAVVHRIGTGFRYIGTVPRGAREELSAWFGKAGNGTETKKRRVANGSKERKSRARRRLPGTPNGRKRLHPGGSGKRKGKG